MKARKALLDWISSMYAGHKVRLSGEPYLEHLLYVAEKSEHAFTLGYETGLCHDLLEDFDLAEIDLEKQLISFSYSKSEAKTIASLVKELTNQFTKEAFPNLGKKERRALKDGHLIGISENAQSIKYSDLAYNAEWMIRNQPRKARKYLLRKKILLGHLTKGDRELWQQAMNEVDAGLKINC